MIDVVLDGGGKRKELGICGKRNRQGKKKGGESRGLGKVKEWGKKGVGN